MAKIRSQQLRLFITAKKKILQVSSKSSSSSKHEESRSSSSGGGASREDINKIRREMDMLLGRDESGHYNQDEKGDGHAPRQRRIRSYKQDEEGDGHAPRQRRIRSLQIYANSF